jgi:hypothetical protein
MNLFIELVKNLFIKLVKNLFITLVMFLFISLKLNIFTIFYYKSKLGARLDNLWRSSM